MKSFYSKATGVILTASLLASQGVVAKEAQQASNDRNNRRSHTSRAIAWLAKKSYKHAIQPAAEVTFDYVLQPIGAQAEKFGTKAYDKVLEPVALQAMDLAELTARKSKYVSLKTKDGVVIGARKVGKTSRWAAVKVRRGFSVLVDKMEGASNIAEKSGSVLSKVADAAEFVLDKTVSGIVVAATTLDGAIATVESAVVDGVLIAADKTEDAAQFTYDVVVNQAIKEVVYQKGIQEGLYGAVLKPAGKFTYEVAVVVYDKGLEPAYDHAIEEAAQSISRAFTFTVKVFKSKKAKNVKVSESYQELSKEQANQYLQK